MEKVLIAGINGFLGRNLASSLYKEGYKVYGISKTDVNLNNVDVYKADILDENRIMDICKDKDHIIHLAAMTEYKKLQNFPVESTKINIIGTFNMLKAFSKSKAKSFIYPSSGKVYGKAHYLPYGELHPTNPETNLGRMKKFCEDLMFYFSYNSNKSFSILRIFNIYGQNQKKDFLIPTVLSQINKGKKEITLGDIKSRRDYIYVKDVIECFLIVLRNYTKGCKIYNVGSGSSYSAEDIVRITEKIKKMKVKIRIDETKLRKNESFEEIADISRLKKLGWEPKYDLEKGLKEMILKS